MKNVVLIINYTIQFILSLLTTWKNLILQKKESIIIPAPSLSIAKKSRQLKSFSIYRSHWLILKIFDITSWNYKQAISFNKNFSFLLIALTLSTLSSFEVLGQQSVSWRTQAANGNWENGDCSSIGTGNSQWWYAGFTPNNSRNRPDCNDGSTTRHNVEIANNHQTTMSLNTAFWGLRSLTLTNAATSNRTFNGSPDDVTRGISLTNGLYNNSNSGVTHNFNVRIGIDASPCTLRTLTSGATTVYNREIFGNANTIVFDGSGATNVTSFISGAGATVSKQGTGTLTLSGANTYTGNTSIVAGILRLGGAAERISNSSNMELNGGTFSTGSAAGFTETLGSLTVSSNSAIAFGTGAHSLTFANSSATTWNGFLLVNGWTGSFNGTAGTAGRFFAGNSASGLSADQLLRVLFLNGSNYHTATILSTGEVVPTASIAMFWNGSSVASWTAANAWSLNPAGPYNQTWTTGRTAYFNLAANTITGASTNVAGIVALGNVTLTGSGTLGFGASGGGIAPIYVASGITFTSTQAFSTAGGTGIRKNGPGVLSSASSNATGLPAGVTLNDGALVWAGNNGFGNGTLTINGGVLSNNNSTAKSPNTVSIVANADFAFGSTALVSAGLGNLTFAATVNLGSSATRTITLGQPATYALNGLISGTGSNLVLNATAAGTLSLGGANTYGGNTTINGGTMLLTTGNNRLPVTTNLTLANTAGVILNLGNRTQTVASLSGGGANGGNIVTGGSTGDLTVNQTTTTSYAGVMSGTGDLIKSGAGILTLSGANTYTGVTTLSAGTLLVNGSTASTSAVSVAASATLGGSGTTAGTVALNGTVAPGSAAATVGVLNAGPFTFNNSSSYTFDISNVSGTAGVNWDLLTSSGQITVNSSSGSPVVISLTGNPTGFNSCTSYSWRIAQGSSISSFTANKFTINTSSFTPAFVGTFSLQQNGNALDLVYTGASLTLTSAAGTNAQLRCINTAITNITYATAGATGASVSGLPDGVTSNWASNVLTISGTPTAYGLYTYSVTLTGTCSSVSTSGTINVNGLDYGNLQFPGTQTICIGNNFTAYGQVFEPGITEPAGANVNIDAQFGYYTSNTDPSTWPAGNWSATTYSTQSGNNDEYRIDFGSALASGTYYYTFRYRINGCSWQYGGAFSGFWNGTTQPSGVLTVSPLNTPGTASSTPTVCINTALTNITRSTTGATGIGTPTGLPAGVTAAWASNVITISGTPSASGTFTYTIPLTGGCGSVNATGTITVTPNNTIARTSAVGTDAQTRCINTAISNITYATATATGATFSGLPAGVNGNWASNVATISGTPSVSGTFNYTVTLTGGCSSVTANGTITVTPANTISLTSAAGTNAQTVCRNTAITNITYNTTGATGATFSGLPAGVSGAWAANVVTISGTTTTAATYNYTVTLTGGCGTVTATGSVIVNPLSVGGTIAGSTSKCAGTNSSTITLSGHTGSIIKWQSSTSSTFASAVTDIANTATTYTATNLSVTTYYRAVVQSGVCSSANSSTATITITQAGSGNFAYSNYGFCTSTTGAQAVASSNFTGVAGTYSSTAGLSIVGASGNILPSASTAGAYVVTYTIPASGGCAAYTTTTNVTIDGTGTGTIAYSPSTICTGTAGTVSPIITGAGGSGASTWFTAAPGTINMDANGVITPSTSTAGSYTITYNRSSTGLCAAYSTTASVTINTSPTITSSTPGSRCGTGSVVLGGVSSTGTVNWYAALTGGTSLASGNTYNTPSISANTTYYADAVSVNGCVAGARTAVLATVSSVPTVATTTPASRCGTGTITLGATASAGTINWYAASTGGASLGTGNSFTTPSISSTTNYFAEAINNGCSSARSTVVATINAIPTVASTTPASNCGTGSVTLGATSTGTLNWYAASTGGASLATGTSYTTPVISSSTTYYVAATANGCTSSPRTAVIAGIATSPSISSFINGSRCNTGIVNLSATPSSGATIKWYSAATGGTLLATGNSYTTPSLSTTTTYYAEATAGTCIQPSRTAITATINATPVVAITADYCTVPGNVVLTANAGMSSYTWSNGGNTQSINVDQAGTYNVFLVSPGGCSAIGSLSVATELVTNGSFNAGNTGFTTSYTYVADIAGQGEMVPEGTYAVVSNPNNVHPDFYGQDRNSPTGKMMVINGSPTLLTVWNQNNIAVLPNTTYYFSGWGMSVVNGQNAILQFSINGSQVGTIAYLPNGYSNTAGPYTWVRFYGQWESGPLTTANLSIVNLNTIAGGNDFALDDISFGTMAPVALSANPVISGNAVCQNEPLVLTAGALGGASPFTYSWTGPNGFTSTLENPLVTSTASSTQNGTYTVQVTDGFGCTSTQNIAISVSAAPTNIVISAAASAVCSGGSTSIELPSSETGVYYQLRNNATNANIGALVQGTGAAISLPTGVLTATTTFNVIATRFPANCDVQMGNTVTVTLSVTPEISITNQAACSGTVNLTAAGVTAGSTGSGTLSYWTTLAATTAVTTPTAVGSGTYYIMSTNGSCFDIEPVVVSISATPSAAYTYASASYCTTGADPIATVTGTAGVFTATPAGLVFVNSNNGEIDLSASAPGSYSVVNTVTPVGACSPVSVTRTVIITAAPLAGFNYVSNDLCQSANALNASPIFDAGASAGTFSTSAGLSLNTTTGVINVSASTPGNYAVVNTRGASGGCPAFSDTTFLDINPYIFTGSVSSSSTDDVICLNETIDLYSNATSYATVLLREKFNGSINNWVNINNSTSGNAANAAWTLRDENYQYSGDNYSSNDDSRFYMSNSRANGSGNTSTILRSPVMSTIGFSTLSLDFFHFFDHRNSGDNAKVQISTNNTTWTDLVTYTSDEGSRTGFTNAVFNLNAYIGLPTVYIRFVFTASNDRAWAIDNVSVTGNSINYGYAWSTSPVGFTSSLQNPTAVAPLVNSFYTVTATNSYGCSTPTSPIPVTVNPLPADNAGIDQNICGSGSVTLGAAATAGNTYAWTPAATLSSATAAQPSANPLANTTYTLTETITATGCAISNDVEVTVTPLPVITSTTPAGRCGTGTVTLSAVSSTGSMKWYANLTGGVALGTANSFTTPSISANTTYYVEATSASCVATSRVAVIATINAAPSISSQATAAASYSQNITATALSVVATAGSGTITGYQWYSNTSASTVGSTELSGATSASYVPSTATVGILYYYCVVTNSNGCSVNSAFSGAINTLLTPTVTSVTGTTPLISGQASATGYRGQTLTINGTNFVSNATVTINGVAATVSFVNSTELRAVVNNTGVNSIGNMVVTNPSNGAFVNSAFNYIGYLTSGTSFDWAAPAAWLGNTTPIVGSNATLAHANTCNSAVTASMNQVTVTAGASLTFGSSSSSLTITDLINNGTITWTSTGTLTIGNTIVFSGAAVFNAGNGTVVFNKAGDQVLFSGLSDVDFNNVTLAGSGNKSLMTNTEMTTNNLIVSAGTTFDLTATDTEVDINGNLTLNGDMNPGTSEFKFTGTVNQSISLAGSGTILFNAMRVDKPSGVLLLNDNIQVQESLTMVQGNIDTQGFLLEIGKDLTQRGTIDYTSGMIQGKLRRWYSASTNAGNASGLFPMGQDVSGSWKNRNVLLEYSVAPTTGGHLTVEFMAIPMINGALGTQNFITPANTGGAGFQVSNFSNDGYWKIDNLTSTLIDGEYTIALSGEGFSLPNGLNELTIVKRVGGGDWFCPGTHLSPTGTAGQPTLHRSGVSGFSNFGFAGGPSNPLPITLVNFDGICDGSNVNLSWTTASESNNKMFVIEVSNDAKTWSTVETISGAGNSNTIRNYTLSVNSSYSDGSYYRLTQIDFNGDSETFDPIYVNCNKQGSNEVSIYPNPAADLANIDIKASENMEIQLTLFSSTGQILFSQKTHVKEGSNIVKLDVNNLKPGMYHLNIVNDKKIEFAGSRSIIKR